MTTSPPRTTPEQSSRKTYTHQFVEHLPDRLEEGVLYVSVRYATAAHNCFCGCGREVVTPLHPTKWRLAFDGISVSLHPSVGSWSLDCKSHYVLERGRIRWADAFSDEKIRTVQERDLRDQNRFYSPPTAPVTPTLAPTASVKAEDRSALKAAPLWRQILNWLSGE